MLAAVLVFPCRAISAQSAILVDADTGRVLYEKNSDKRSLIASTTKIMTALVVCEQCNVLDRVRIPKEAVGIEGSSMYLQEGEILTVQELLYGLMLRSGNDAAVALAIYCGGTVEGFSQLMNDKAHRLDLRNTHFENPHGLDSPGHYSTASDLATLTVYAMKNPIFRKTVSTKNVTVGSRSLQNHNKLLWQYPGANGVKTGYTKAAGRILVSGAEREGRQLICVTMNAPDDWEDHRRLLDYGSSGYTMMKILEKGKCVGTVEVAGGDQESVTLLASEDFYYAVRNDEVVNLALQEPGFVYAPVCKGQDAGTAYIMIGESVIGKVGLVYGCDAQILKDTRPSLWDRIFGRNAS